MVEAYWLIGKRIVEEIQQGGNRANYGEQIIKNLSRALTAEFGKGFQIEVSANIVSFIKHFKNSQLCEQ